MNTLKCIKTYSTTLGITYKNKIYKYYYKNGILFIQGEDSGFGYSVIPIYINRSSKDLEEVFEHYGFDNGVRFSDIDPYGEEDWNN